ncbi:MAG: ParA family protein, partial [Microbacteriaceae bacterium]|nr:ParA family protein [Microbacteriaceae bacterium]
HSGHIDLLLGSPSAINFDGPHPTQQEMWRLEEALSIVESDYDIVFIDCAPSLNALTRTAWAASDRVFVVTEPGLLSVAAADRALRAIDEVRTGISPRFEPLGIVINRAHQNSQEHQFRIREMREMFGALVLDPIFDERTAIQQAQGSAKPIHIWPGEATQQLAAQFDQLLDIAAQSLQLTVPHPAREA